MTAISKSVSHRRRRMEQSAQPGKRRISMHSDWLISHQQSVHSRSSLEHVLLGLAQSPTQMSSPLPGTKSTLKSTSSPATLPTSRAASRVSPMREKRLQWERRNTERPRVLQEQLITQTKRQVSMLASRDPVVGPFARTVDIRRRHLRPRLIERSGREVSVAVPNHCLHGVVMS